MPSAGGVLITMTVEIGSIARWRRSLRDPLRNSTDYDRVTLSNSLKAKPRAQYWLPHNEVPQKAPWRISNDSPPLIRSGRKLEGILRKTPCGEDRDDLWSVHCYLEEESLS